MGSRIAARLLDHGHELVVWNRDAAKAEPLVAQGATAAESPSAAASAAEATLTMVTDPDALVAVTEGDAGVVAGLAEDGFLIQMSTVSPEATERLGLDREIVFKVLSSTPLAATAERRRTSVESGDYPPRFALHLARKDGDLILAAAGDDLRLTRAARDWLAEAEESGLADADYSAVLAR